MSVVLASAKATVGSALNDGLTAIDLQLQAQFETGSPDAALILALNGLRSKYVFDLTRVVRSQITALDSDPATKEILVQLGNACDDLTAIQEASAGTNDWINKISSGVDSLFGRYSKIVTLSS